MGSSPQFLHGFTKSSSKPIVPQETTNLFFAGQMTGVGGYVESAASESLVAGSNAARLSSRVKVKLSSETTAIGSLAHYITHADMKHISNP